MSKFTEETGKLLREVYHGFIKVLVVLPILAVGLVILTTLVKALYVFCVLYVWNHLPF